VNTYSTLMPIRQPPGFKWIEDDPTFDPKIHLQLEKPEKIWSMVDFGYDKKQLKFFHFPLAITCAFRLLSDEGLKELRKVVKQLEAGHRTSDRIASFVRGGGSIVPNFSGIFVIHRKSQHLFLESPRVLSLPIRCRSIRDI